MGAPGAMIQCCACVGGSAGAGSAFLERRVLAGLWRGYWPSCLLTSTALGTFAFPGTLRLPSLKSNIYIHTNIYNVCKLYFITVLL